MIIVIIMYIIISIMFSSIRRIACMIRSTVLYILFITLYGYRIYIYYIHTYIYIYILLYIILYIYVVVILLFLCFTFSSRRRSPLCLRWGRRRGSIHGLVHHRTWILGTFFRHRPEEALASSIVSEMMASWGVSVVTQELYVSVVPWGAILEDFENLSTWKQRMLEIQVGTGNHPSWCSHMFFLYGPTKSGSFWCPRARV